MYEYGEYKRLKRRWDDAKQEFSDGASEFLYQITTTEYR